MDVLGPLTRLAGVRHVSVVSNDGVPLAVLERSGRGGEFVARSTGDETKLAGRRIDPASFGALAAGWADEVTRAIAPLSWDTPWRIALVATQGTLIVQQGPGAFVLVVVEPGTPPDSLAIPLDGAVARMERLLKSLGRHADTNEAPSLVGDTASEAAPAAVSLDPTEEDPSRSARQGGPTPTPSSRVNNPSEHRLQDR